MCSEPLIPRLSSVQWAPHFWHCLRLTDEVYTVCSGPLIPNFPWKMRLTQCATSPSSIIRMRFSQCAVAPHPWLNLKDEVYPVCNQPLIPKRWSLPVCSGPFISLEGGGLPSVQWALHHSWERRFTQCAVGPSSLLRDEVYLLYSGPLIPPERGGVPGVQWALHPPWERRFT